MGAVTIRPATESVIELTASKIGGRLEAIVHCGGCVNGRTRCSVHSDDPYFPSASTRVYDEPGAFLEHAQFLVEGSNGLSRWVGPEFGKPCPLAQPLPPGRYSLEFDDPDHVWAWVPFEIVAGRTTELCVTLPVSTGSGRAIDLEPDSMVIRE